MPSLVPILMQAMMALHVAVTRIPVVPPLREEIEKVPDRGIGVNATVVALVKLRPYSVAVINRAVWSAREDTQPRVL